MENPMAETVAPASIKIRGPIGLFLRLKEAADRVDAWFPKPYNGIVASQVTSEVPLNLEKFNALVAGIDAVIADHEKAVEQLRADKENIVLQAAR
jgi:hypothetical protein